MLSLLLAIISSTAISLILKYSESKNLNRYAVTSANYIVAFSISLFLIITADLFIPSVSNISEFPDTFKHINNLNETESFFWACFTGIIVGIFYFLGFIFIQKSINDNGVGITGAFARISIILPMFMSLFIFNEKLTIITGAGISLALVSIFLAGFDYKSEKHKKIQFSLILVFLVTGFGEFGNKIFQNYALAEYKNVFLFSVFFVAFWISLCFSGFKNFKKKEILTGFAVGLPNFLASFFLIGALKEIRAVIAFPLYSAGSIILITLGGRFIFFRKS